MSTITQHHLPHKEAMETSFDWILYPLKFSEFQDTYFEKKPLHIERKDATYYQHILTADMLDTILYNQSMKYPALKLTNANDDINHEKYLYGENRVNYTELLKQFSQGATIIMSGLHEHLASLGELTTQLTKSCFHKFQTNIYITPKNSQGFKYHYDTHDVFALQIHGKKTWKIFGESPIELPTKMQEFETGKYESGPLMQELEVNAGDLLYIPRGIMHQAETNDELSIHITLGWLGFTWTDLLLESILELSKKNVEFRKYLPTDMLKDEPTEGHQATLTELWKLCAERMSLKESANRFKKEIINGQKPNLINIIKIGSQVQEVNPETIFELRTNVILNIRRKDEQIALEWLGKLVEFPQYTEEAIQFIINSKVEFNMKDIPDCIDDEGKIVLLKRLTREGLLKIK